MVVTPPHDYSPGECRRSVVDSWPAEATAPSGTDCFTRSSRSWADSSREHLIHEETLGRTHASNLGCQAELSGSCKSTGPHSFGLAHSRRLRRAVGSPECASPGA